MTEQLTAEDRIKQAAIRVFMDKGMHGARMQDIADEANINKAMLHYYFRNKQQLFEVVFQHQFFKLFQSLSTIIFSESTFEEQVPELVAKEIELFSEIPTLPLFVLDSAWRNPDLIKQLMSDKPIDMVKKTLQKTINDAVKRNVIRHISVEQFLMNLMSLVIYPFIAKPLFSTVFNKSDKQYEVLLKKRKTEITELIMNSLKPNQDD